MVFHTSRQRKAVMAKLRSGNNNPPTPSILSRIKTFREQRAERGEQRAQKEQRERVDEIKKLSVRLKQEREMLEQKRTLSELKQEEAMTKRQLKSFTTRGKIEERLKIGAQRIGAAAGPAVRKGFKRLRKVRL